MAVVKKTFSTFGAPRCDWEHTANNKVTAEEMIELLT